MSSLMKSNRSGALSRPSTLTNAADAGDRVVLSDISSSMAGRVGGYSDDSPRKIDRLREVIYSFKNEGLEFRQIVFGGIIELRDDIPEPQGGTPLAQALELAARQEPKSVSVVSDGEPDSMPLALEAAAKLGCPIHTFYVGPPNAMAEDFMRRLAGVNPGGSSFVGDLGKGVAALQDGVKKTLLSLPAPIAL